MNERLYGLKEQLDDIDSEIYKIQQEIKKADLKIAMIKKANQERQVLLDKLYAEKNNIKDKMNDNYLNLSNCDIKNIGLYNTAVKKPVAKCNYHNVYLDYKNVTKRKCVIKMCKEFEWLEGELF